MNEIATNGNALIDQQALAKKTRKTFYLVCANFLMLFVLFAGLGFLTWQSVSLVKMLKSDLARAEQTIVELRESVKAIDSEVLVNRAVDTAVAAAVVEIADSMPDSDALAALSDVPEKIEATTQAIQEINEKVQDIDAQLIAQHVSYELLKGLGDGFSEAAESRKP